MPRNAKKRAETALQAVGASHTLLNGVAALALGANTLHGGDDSSIARDQWLQTGVHALGPPSFIQGGMSTPIGARQWVPWDRKWCVGLHSRDWLDSGGAHLRDFHFIGGYPFARAEKLTFRARFEIVDFGPKTRPETAGKLQSVRRKNVPISAF